MASSSEPKRAHRRARYGASLLLVTMATAIGCRTGLPPEPPDHDATNPDATIPAYSPGPNPLSTSAFAGQKLRKGGHEHHGHGGHGMAAKKGDTVEPAPTDTNDAPKGGHAGHTPAPAPSDTADSTPEVPR